MISLLSISLWKRLIIPLAFITSLAASVFFYQMYADNRTAKIFYYPDNSGLKEGGETRAIPQNENLESKIRIFIEELILGPVNLNFSRVLPLDTKVRYVIVSENRIFVDLSFDSLVRDENFILSFDLAMRKLGQNIRKNFPQVGDVVLSIEGQEIAFSNE